MRGDANPGGEWGRDSGKLLEQREMAGSLPHAAIALWAVFSKAMTAGHNLPGVYW